MKSFKFNSFEITPREIIVSVAIAAIMLLVGILITGGMNQYRMDKNEIYNKAVKIETADLFQYGMRTNVGNAFVSGELSAIDPVSYPEIDGEYLYLEKVKEKYTMHTRQVRHTTTVNGKTHTYYTTETYWTWDTVGRESINSTQVCFNDVIFDYDKIDYSVMHYIDTVKESYYIRYKYYGVNASAQGTIFTTLKDNTISDHSHFYENKTVEETYEIVLHRDWTVLFWIIWIGLIAGLIFGFCYIDNRWLY